MIARLRKHAGEKGLGGLFEPLGKPKIAGDIAVSDTDVGRILISEPDLDPSVPPEVFDRPWLV